MKSNTRTFYDKTWLELLAITLLANLRSLRLCRVRCLVLRPQRNRPSISQAAGAIILGSRTTSHRKKTDSDSRPPALRVGVTISRPLDAEPSAAIVSKAVITLVFHPEDSAPERCLPMGQR